MRFIYVCIYIYCTLCKRYNLQLYNLIHTCLKHNLQILCDDVDMYVYIHNVLSLYIHTCIHVIYIYTVAIHDDNFVSGKCLALCKREYYIIYIDTFSSIVCMVVSVCSPILGISLSFTSLSTTFSAMLETFVICYTRLSIVVVVYVRLRIYKRNHKIHSPTIYLLLLTPSTSYIKCVLYSVI